MPKPSRAVRTGPATRKTPAKKAAANAPVRGARGSGPKPVRRRGLKRLNYRYWRQSRRYYISRQVRLPSVWRLSAESARLLWRSRRLFAGIILIYGLLTFVLVKGLSGTTNVGALKSQFGQLFTGHWGGLASSLTVFASLVGSNSSGAGNSAGTFQVLLLLVGSLAVVWALRQVLAGSRPRIRDAYYRGMYPLVPVILVLLVVSLDLIPLTAGAAIYAQVVTNNIAVNFVENAAFGLLFILLAAWSFYLLSSSLFAFYIAMLPDMTPLQALRSARELVRYRRGSVLLKVLFLPLGLLAASLVIVIPVIAIAAPAAQWIFFTLTVAMVAVVHAYMYSLYRELLQEKQLEEAHG
jgi:hypothetical protein